MSVLVLIELKLDQSPSPEPYFVQVCQFAVERSLGCVRFIFFPGCVTMTTPSVEATRWRPRAGGRPRRGSRAALTGGVGEGGGVSGGRNGPPPLVGAPRCRPPPPSAAGALPAAATCPPVGLPRRAVADGRARARAAATAAPPRAGGAHQRGGGERPLRRPRLAAAPRAQVAGGRDGVARRARLWRSPRRPQLWRPALPRRLSIAAAAGPAAAAAMSIPS